MESIFPKDLLSCQEWSKPALNAVMELAERLKLERQTGIPHVDILKGRSLFSIFYNTSTRTRTSFMAAMTQLGGETHTLDPAGLQASIGEVIKDTAGVLSRYGDAISVRYCFVKEGYGEGHNVLRTYAQESGVPVINMECDTYHPCQVLADWLTIRQHFGSDNLAGKKFVVSWAYGKYIRPVAVPQSLVLLMTRLGMNVTLAHPEGFDLDPKIIGQAKENAQKAGGELSMTNSMDEAFQDADVVYPKNWGPLEIMPDLDRATEFSIPHKDWIATQDRMAQANNGIYMHCLPCDRGLEVEDAVIDGPQSAVMEQAENRLHAQKALLALLINNRSKISR
ncbi:MAG: N-acetylornithine carbamoyltransferase [Candidatus Heimdallarchaeota archaeon]